MSPQNFLIALLDDGLALNKLEGIAPTPLRTPSSKPSHISPAKTLIVDNVRTGLKGSEGLYAFRSRG